MSRVPVLFPTVRLQIYLAVNYKFFFFGNPAFRIMFLLPRWHLYTATYTSNKKYGRHKTPVLASFRGTQLDHRIDTVARRRPTMRPKMLPPMNQNMKISHPHNIVWYDSMKTNFPIVRYTGVLAT